MARVGAELYFKNAGGGTGVKPASPFKIEEAGALDILLAPQNYL